MNRQYLAFSGLAILLVVLNHSITIGDATGLGYPVDNGILPLIVAELGVFAVPTFLFISGCFFSYAATAKLSFKLIWANIKRLLIPYIFWSILFYIAIYLGQGKTYTIWGYLKNLIVGYPFNFVPLIIFFYLISPLLIVLGKRIGWVLILLIGLYQLLLITLLHPEKMGIVLPNWMNLFSPPILRSTLETWAIFFPLGIVFGLKGQALKPWLIKYRWLLVIATVILYILHILDLTTSLIFPMAFYFVPLTFTALIPAIKRDEIPFVRSLEKIGKRSYGLYLSSLIVIYSAIVIIHAYIPWLIVHPAFLYPILFLLGLEIPLNLMIVTERLPNRMIYEYVFE